MKKFISSFIVLGFVPFGNKIFASDCGTEFVEGVQQCTELYPAENPITGILQVICIIGEGIQWIICQVGNML